MNARRAAIAALLAATAGWAGAQDSASPYDKNPQCAERTTDGNSPDCVIQQDGQPRRLYPPGRQVIPTPPPAKPPVTPVTPPSRERARPGAAAH